MLKNKGTRVQVVGWNGVSFSIKPGETFDVKKFGEWVDSPLRVHQMEDRLVFKSQGELEVVGTKKEVPPPPEKNANDTGAGGAASEKKPKAPKEPKKK